ncbi:hypothetical protein AVHY2522_23820 [Acidovorax sp. SUPP2522]|uniref:hypothetical protein n=1 Tax=Acidovorax sp. SUPP2522 TaxID=511900 RepID=UPI0023DE5543|nr:hypothetical protein [Acidovorax sp. SUPP2522]GKT19801.1 hypothetical protein AVHY2522_23820 [Acidovorax sp. SUPP2522]
MAMATPLLALLVVPTWRILQRAGFNGAWALLMLVPIVGILVLWFVSFLKWPADREGSTHTSKGWLVLGVLLVPLAIVGPVLVGKLAVEGKGGRGADSTSARPAPLANPACSDIDAFLGGCKK